MVKDRSSFPLKKANVVKSATNKTVSLKEIVSKNEMVKVMSVSNEESNLDENSANTPSSNVIKEESKASIKQKRTTENWKKLQNKFQPTQNGNTNKKRKLAEMTSQSAKTSANAAANNYKHQLRDKVVAMDCEMVGIGFNGKTSALARCSIVDFDGNVLYDKYVRPKGDVTNYRTRWSGITKEHLKKNNSITLEECQQSVVELIEGKIVIGHALQNDWRVLMLSHPLKQIRDTSFYKPYMTLIAGDSGKHTSRSLKDLSREILGKDIQKGPHNSVEDAQATMELYKHVMEDWETELHVKHKESKSKRKKTNDTTIQQQHEVVATNENTQKTKKQKSFNVTSMFAKTTPPNQSSNNNSAKFHRNTTHRDQKKNKKLYK